MFRRILAVAAVTVAAIPVLACHDDHDHDGEAASCKAIVEACHPKDTGSGPIHECHEFAESGKTEADCAAKKAECLATCAQGPTDAGAD
jgi:hypothetical protein